MGILRNLSLKNSRLPSRAGLDSSPSKPRGITSIARQTGRISAFRQFGDSVSQTKSTERSGKIFGSISRAIKDKNNPTSTLPGSTSGPKINPAYKPIVK